MRTLAEKMTDDELKKLEKKINTLYYQASKDMQAEMYKYIGDMTERDKKMLDRLDKDEIDYDYYKAWKRNQMGRGQRMNAMYNALAKRAHNANERANAYVNGGLAQMYALNRNIAAYEIEKVTEGVDFTLFNEQAVKRLLVEEPNVMPHYPRARALRRGIDMDYSHKVMQNIVTNGIIKGSSIKDIVEALPKQLASMGQISAIRAARTMTTSAANGGYLDTMHAAKDAGIDIKKQWYAFIDSRTRGSHSDLNGEIKPLQHKFSNGLMFPADPKGKAAEVYNCRCTMLNVVDGHSVLTEEKELPQFKAWQKQKQKQQAPAPAVSVTVFDRFEQQTSAEFVQKANEMLANCGNDDVINLFKKYATDLAIKDANLKKGAYFNPTYDGIFFNWQKTLAGDSCHKPMQTLFHEFGHMLDFLANGRNRYEYICQRAEYGLYTALQEDYKNLRKAAGKVDQIPAYIRANATDTSIFALGSVSDALECLSNKSYPLGVGHGSSYWKSRGKENALPKEFIAEVIDGIVAGKSSAEAMQQFFPNGYSVALKIIKDAAK